MPGSIALLVAFVCLYVRSIDVHATNALWHNFVFDADIDRIVQDAQRGQGDAVFARHPLFVLTLALPASAVARLGVSSITSLRFIAAFAGGLGVAGARSLFLRITRDRIAAVLFAVLYGLAASVWLLSSIPETFALSAAAIVGLFLLHDASSVRPREHTARFTVFVLLSALAIGVTVANAIYVGLVAAASARAADASWSKRAARVAVAAVAVAVAFVALSLLQAGLQGPRVVGPPVVASPLAAIHGDRFLDVTRGLSLSEALVVARAFLLDNLVAPGPVVAIVREPQPTLSGFTQMIQYGGWTAPTYVLAVAALVVFAVAAMVRGDRRAFAASERVQLALAFIASNLVLHYFYRANGQPLIFSIHTVLPVVVLLAEAHARARGAIHRLLAVVAVLALGLNNTLFLGGVRAALALPCRDRLPLVCAAWASAGADRRYTVGLADYLASPEYRLDEGIASSDHGDFAAAADYYGAALAMRPGWLPAERGLGVCDWRLGRVDEAIVRLGRVLKGDPSDDDVRKLLDRLTRGPELPTR
jgi:hypothetical protein